MRSFLTVCLATATVIAVAGVAAAEIRNAHVMTVRLPDGSVEQIRYVGDRPPQVSVQPMTTSAIGPIFDPFAADAPLAAMDRLSRELDQQAAALFQQAFTLAKPLHEGPGALMQADFSKLPPGVQGYSIISTVSGQNVCTRSIRYVSGDAGQAPKVLTQTSGDCGEGASPASRSPGSGVTTGGHAAGLIQATYRGPQGWGFDPS